MIIVASNLDITFEPTRMLVNALDEAFKKEPDAICFVNYTFLSVSGMDTEFDVLLLHRSLGLFVFEVKGYRTDYIGSVSDTSWKLLDPPITVQEPHRQARKSLAVLFRRFRRTDESHLKTLLDGYSFVVFPRISSVQWREAGFPTLPENTLFEDELQSAVLRQKLENAAAERDINHLSDVEWQEARSLFDVSHVALARQTTGEHREPPTLEKSDQARIFVSYRRSDSEMVAGRIVDHLIWHFGEENVFQDIVSLQPGMDFVEHINNAISSSRIVVVVIGRMWLEASSSDGKRRLDEPRDLVRLEVSIGLERRNEGNIILIPILVEGASMPRAEELPAPLQRLSSIQAVRLDSGRFREDIGRLIAYLEGVMNPE